MVVVFRKDGRGLRWKSRRPAGVAVDLTHMHESSLNLGGSHEDGEKWVLGKTWR